MRTMIIALMVSLFMAFPAYGQISCIPGQNCGGEIPVHDKDNLASNVLQAVRLLAQLRDMLTQARTWDVLRDGRTDQVLDEIANYSNGDALLYGNDGSNIWREVYTYDLTFPEGNALDAELGRDWIALNTQQTMLHHAELQRMEDEADQERIDALQERMDTAVGRNQIELAVGAAQMEAISQQRKTRQMLQSLTNSVSVMAGYVVNEKVAQRAQERAFVKNFDRPVPRPVWNDPGLAPQVHGQSPVWWNE